MSADKETIACDLRGTGPCGCPTACKVNMDQAMKAPEPIYCATLARRPAVVSEGQAVARSQLQFIDDVIEVAFEGGDLDGGTIQGWAEKADLLVATTMTEPCTEDQRCRCAVDNDFPLTCYRKTYRASLNALNDAAAPAPEAPTAAQAPEVAEITAEQARAELMAMPLDEVVKLVQGAPVAEAPTGWGWQELRDDVLHGVDGLDNDQINIVLGMIDHYMPVAAPATEQAKPNLRTIQRDAAENAISARLQSLGLVKSSPAKPDLAGLTTLKRAIDCLEILDKRPRPMCRDCADEDGVCPHGGLSCDMRKLIADSRALLAAITKEPGA